MVQFFYGVANCQLSMKEKWRIRCCQLDDRENTLYLNEHIEFTANVRAMATFQNTLHVSEHSADGKLYALLSFDGKLKIWNTETNELQREFVPNFHLNAPFTCFTWITVNGTLGPRKVSVIHDISTFFQFHS